MFLFVTVFLGELLQNRGMEIVDTVSQIVIAGVSMTVLLLTVMGFAALLGQVVSKIFED